MEKEVIINNKKYSIDDENIVVDYFSKEIILKQDAVVIASRIELYNTLENVIENVYCSKNDIINHLENHSVYILYFNSGNSSIYCLRNYKNIGEGGVKSAKNKQEYPYGIFDMVTHSLLNVNPNKYRPFDNIVKVQKDYNSPLLSLEDRKYLLNYNQKFGVESSTYKMFDGHKYTFGIEIECNSGRLTEKDVEGLNLKCEFDGSLRDTPDQKKEDVLGGEYITGVLKGDAGLFQLKNISNKLAEKCTVNEKCGLHVHIGGIQLNKENIVYLYKLGEILENEFFEMLPVSRRNNAYCKRLKKLNIDLNKLNSAKSPIEYNSIVEFYYSKIVTEVSHGKLPTKNVNKSTNHPMGSKCGYDKNTQRYCWLNFVTALFNTKGNKNAMTLEFRNHHSVLDYQKIKNWLKICMAFVAFVENHKASLKRGYWLDKTKTEYSICLSTILLAVYPKTHKNLTNYVESRKQLFAGDNILAEKLEYETKVIYDTISKKEEFICV